jgi:hypothetical protein
MPLIPFGTNSILSPLGYCFERHKIATAVEHASSSATAICLEPVLKLLIASQQHVSEADPDHSFRRSGAEFIVFARPSGPTHPGEVSLHDPAFGQHLEGAHFVSLDHLDIVNKLLFIQHCGCDALLYLHKIRINWTGVSSKNCRLF